MRSLRSSLLRGTVLAVAAVLALAAMTLYALVQRSLLGELDRGLVAQARWLASTVVVEEGSLDLEFLEFDMERFASPERGGFLQLGPAQGEAIYRSPSLGEATLLYSAPDTDLGTQWVDLPGGVRARAAVLRFQPRVENATPAAAPQELTLVLAQDAGQVAGTLATLRGLLVIVGLAALLAAGLVLELVVRRSLHPVRTIAERIAAIGEEDLEARLEVAEAPRELLPIVERINGLLSRLGAAFARERAFSDDVAHELRLPLSGLRTTLEVTATRPRSDQEYAAALREGASIVTQLQGMVERLLQLARLEAGRSAIERERCDMADLALEAWEPFAVQAQARGLRVDLKLEDGLEASVDRGILDLILRNLYENAVTYADGGGSIRIGTRRTGERTVCLQVSNSGSHLSQDEASAAKGRFWRGETARTHAGLHCGLGLALVDKAARALDGHLELRSAIDGQFVAEVTISA